MGLGLVLGIGKEAAVLGTAAGSKGRAMMPKYAVPVMCRALRKGIVSKSKILLLKCCIICSECKFALPHHR